MAKETKQVKEISTKEISKFEEKRGLIDALENVIDHINSEKRWTLQHYTQVGKETEQATDSDGNLRWEDDEQTIPYYKPIYDYVDKDPEQLSDSDYAKYLAYNKILETLETLI